MEMTGIDLGLLGLRAVMAFILFAHATQKLFGWFSGSGPAASAALFEKLGQRPGRTMVYVAATCEILAAASLLLGLFLPLGIAIGVGTMVVAGFSLSRLSGTFWNAAGGGEYPFFIAFVLIALSFLGSGTLSLDSGLGLALADDRLFVAAAGPILGLLAAAPPILRGRRAAESVPRSD